MSDQLPQTEVQEELEERDYDAEARDMGWVEEDKFRGPKGQWTDAKTFVEKGEHILPILRATRDKLRNENLTKDKEIANLKASQEASAKAIKALQKSYTEEANRRVDEAIRETKEKLKLAHEAGDVDAFLDLQESLTNLKDAKKEAKEENPEGLIATHPNTSDQNQLTPEFKDWQAENRWFGNKADPEDWNRTKALYRIGEDLRDDGDKTEGRAFFDKCMKVLEEREAGRTNNAPKKSKVEGSDNTSRRSGGRDFDNLPKEAKSACHEDTSTFVGPGKKFKTVKDWEDEYARLYLGQE